MRRRTTQSIVANPVLIGAVTVLVTVVAVYLAYNANSGLPFVPTYELNAKVPNAGRLVEGNDVREGGYRIGVVEKITPVREPDGTAGAKLRLKLDKQAGPVPMDSTITIRPRSALGLKYVELVRGLSHQELANGSTINMGQGANTVELDDFFGIFDQPTRDFSQRNLTEFGGAFAARGIDLNLTLQSLPGLLGVLQPVASNLADPRTQLGQFFRDLAQAARATAPVADSLAKGFTSGADVFEAFSRYPDRLAQTIEKSPPTLDVGTASLVAQRPFLRHLAGVSGELRGAAQQVRISLPGINAALLSGTQVLPRVPELNARLTSTLQALDALATTPTTNLTLRGLTSTVSTLSPTLRYVGPYVTVCNYWNYFWTYLSEHLTDQSATGQIERVLGKTSPPQDNGLSTFGASHPANGEGSNPITNAILGDPAFLHAQPYGAAITGGGSADCENGQRGYPRRIANDYDPRLKIVTDPHTPGAQGPTYTGQHNPPAHETYSAAPDFQSGIDPSDGVAP